MDFHFDLKHIPEHYRTDNEALFDYFHGPLRKSAIQWMVYATVFGLVAYLQFYLEQDITMIVFLFLTVLMMVGSLTSFANLRKAKKVFEERITEDGKAFEKHPEYSIWFNEEEFGTKSKFYQLSYAWSKTTVVEVHKGNLFVKLFPDALHMVSISKLDIGEEKFNELFKAVTEKIAGFEKHESE